MSTSSAPILDGIRPARVLLARCSRGPTRTKRCSSPHSGSGLFPSRHPSIEVRHHDAQPLPDPGPAPCIAPGWRVARGPHHPRMSDSPGPWIHAPGDRLRPARCGYQRCPAASCGRVTRSLHSRNASAVLDALFPSLDTPQLLHLFTALPSPHAWMRRPRHRCSCCRHL